MNKIILLNKNPFLRNRLIAAFIILTLLAIITVYQLSKNAGGWIALHEQSFSIVVIELLPILFLAFLLFVTSNKHYGETHAAYESKHQTLVDNVSSTLEKIKSGNFNKDTDVTGENQIDTALRNIYDKFKADADEDRHRSWVNEGLAVFRESMSAHSEIKPMCEEAISRLVKYLKTNQGGIFVLNQDKKLELTSCYAFERKKYLTKILNPGEGLVGQCFVEGHRIYMTKVPENYITITSGLGAANPQCILIIPLKLKDTTVGVLELAGFKPYKEYQLEFIEKAAEALAQSISTIHVSEETKKLLENSLLREREMKDQEESMRQNMEELYVTQEDMRKVNLEMEEIFKAINTLTSTVELNRNGNITKLNDRFLQTLKFEAQDLYGKPFTSFLHKTQEDGISFSTVWSGVLEGKWTEEVFTYRDPKGGTRWLRTGFYPLKGNNGIERIMCFLTDLTEDKNRELEMDQLNQNMEAFRKMLIRILNEIPLKIFLKQYNGKFFVVNHAVSSFHGFETAEGLIGKSDFDFYDHKDAAEWLEAEHKIIAEGRTEYVHEDGGRILQTVKMPFYIDPLKETGLLGFQADVTELEKLKKEIEVKGV